MNNSKPNKASKGLTLIAFALATAVGGLSLVRFSAAPSESDARFNWVNISDDYKDFFSCREDQGEAYFVMQNTHALLSYIAKGATVKFAMLRDKDQNPWIWDVKISDPKTVQLTLVNYGKTETHMSQETLDAFNAAAKRIFLNQKSVCDAAIRRAQENHLVPDGPSSEDDEELHPDYYVVRNRPSIFDQLVQTLGWDN